MYSQTKPLQYFNITEEQTDEVFFRVVKTPSIEIIPRTAINPNLGFAVVGFPKSNNYNRKLLNLVSDKYKVVEFPHIVVPFERAFDKAGYSFEVVYKNENDCVLTAEYRFKSKARTMSVSGDEMDPTVTLYHSYDGSVAFDLKLGARRCICNNGMSIEVKESFRKKYTIGLDNDYISSCVKVTMEYLAKFKDLLKVFKVMEERQLTEFEQKCLVDDITTKTDFGTSSVGSAIARAKMEMETIQGSSDMNAWYFYQGFNYQLQHERNLSEVNAFKLDRQIQKVTYDFCLM